MRLQKLSLQIPASRVFPWTGPRSKYRGVSFEGKKITSTFISTATISTEELACRPMLSPVGCGNLERNWGAAAYVKQGAQYNDELTMNASKEASYRFHRHILSHYVTWNEQKSLRTSQITILIFPKICFLAIYVQLKAKPRRGIFHGTRRVLTSFNNRPISTSLSTLHFENTLCMSEP